MLRSTRETLLTCIGLPLAGSYLLNTVNNDLRREGGNSLRLEDTLPEPFDYFDHVGNVTVSWFAGNGLTRFFAYGINRWGSEAARTRIGKVAATAAVVAVAAANVAVEIGQAKLGMPGGMIDTGYGLGGAALGAASVDAEQLYPQPEKAQADRPPALDDKQ